MYRTFIMLSSKLISPVSKAYIFSKKQTLSKLSRNISQRNIKTKIKNNYSPNNRFNYHQSCTEINFSNKTLYPSIKTFGKAMLHLSIPVYNINNTKTTSSNAITLLNSSDVKNKDGDKNHSGEQVPSFNITYLDEPKFLPDDILHFWFHELKTPQQWFMKDSEFDALLRERYSTLHTQVDHDLVLSWQDTPESTLAKIIVLDQFSRNMFRDTPESFLYDRKARELVYSALAKGYQHQLPPIQQAFLYMPLMHSEDIKDHELAMELYSQTPELEQFYFFEKKHKVIIDRFGRYPHRNAILGRASTQEETEFLSQPGSSF